MAQGANHIEVYLEIGRTRTFAVALDWPGWCRSGRDEAAALQALYDYGPRYARALSDTQLRFRAPSQASALVVVERLTGNATTNFGAPNQALSRDTKPIDPTELELWQVVLKACWQTFDTAVRAATGQRLRKGPRGGGRDASARRGEHPKPGTRAPAPSHPDHADCSSARRGASARTARRGPLDSALFCAPPGLARARSHLGE